MKNEGTRTRWARLTGIVDQALDIVDHEERQHYLDEACGWDALMRAEVDNLLQFADATWTLLDRPSVPTDPWGTLQPNETIGPYRVEGLLGEGGMGAVYQVHDDTLERSVALKLVHRERLTPDLLRRFHDERRLLARLNHPGIARIHGGGSLEDPQGGSLPFFTMEMVDGVPIDQYCLEQYGEDYHGSVKERIRLVLYVCDALSYAHRNLIVHRDLKPSNILVNSVGAPKLLDFGIAKDLVASTENAATLPGLAPMTLAYASPEQVRGQPVTTAVDVYSLAVVLYRLLCGRAPHVLSGDVVVDAQRICNDEPDVSGLKGDLRTVVQKALSKNPVLRYASMDEFATDLRNYLEGRPVKARRATLGYRVGKFIRRNRRRLAAAAFILVMIVLNENARRENAQKVELLAAEQRQTAEEARLASEQADTMAAFLKNIFDSASPDEQNGETLTADEILRRSAARARNQLQDHPATLALQLEAIGATQQTLGRWDLALELHEEAFQERRKVYSGDHPLLARNLNNLAAAEHRLGGKERAEALYRLALKMRQRLGERPVDLARIESNLALLVYERGDMEEAETLYRRILTTRRAAVSNGRLDAGLPDLSNSLRSLGMVLYRRGKYAEAEGFLSEALERRRRFEEDIRPSRIAAALESLGHVYRETGRETEAKEAFQEALDIYQRLYGEESRRVEKLRAALQGEA